jgi:hypothetical protein
VRTISKVNFEVKQPNPNRVAKTEWNVAVADPGGPYSANSDRLMPTLGSAPSLSRASEFATTTP